MGSTHSLRCGLHSFAASRLNAEKLDDYRSAESAAPPNSGISPLALKGVGSYESLESEGGPSWLGRYGQAAAVDGC